MIVGLPGLLVARTATVVLPVNTSSLPSSKVWLWGVPAVGQPILRMRASSSLSCSLEVWDCTFTGVGVKEAAA